jgi:hypothetical protein
MVILRPTRKLRSLLPAEEVGSARFDTALGDWYVNRIVVDREPLLLLVSSTSLLPMRVAGRHEASAPGVPSSSSRVCPWSAVRIVGSYLTAATLQESQHIRKRWRKLAVEKRVPVAKFKGAA